MDLSHNASNSPKSSATPKPSLYGENNENHVKQGQMGSSKSHNSKKHFHKHFMSPTVSATSKASSVQRKKILAENNESMPSFDGHFQKSPLLESRSGLLQYSGSSNRARRSSSGDFSAKNSSSHFDDEEFVDSSLKPYDPLTNYLSPRPRYLRYKPNCRREILDRRQSLDEKEDGPFLERSSSFKFNNILDDINPLDCVEVSLISPSYEGIATVKNQETIRAGKGNCDDDGSFLERTGSFESINIVDGIKPLDCVKGSLISPPREGTSTVKNRETTGAENDNCVDNDGEEDEEEDIEEFEEEKICSLKGLLKFLLLLVVIDLSISYISSMSSPKPMQPIIGGHEDGYYRILNYSLESIPRNFHGGNLGWTQTGQEQAGFSGVNQRSSHQGSGKLQMIVDDEEVLVENGDDIVRMPESVNARNLDICVTGFNDSDTILHHFLNVNTAGSKSVDSDRVDFDLPQLDIAENVTLDGEIGMVDDFSDQNPGIEGAKNDGSQGLQVQELMENLDLSGDQAGCGGSASVNDEVDEIENNLEAGKVESIFMENAGEELEDTEETAGVTGTMEDEEIHYKVENFEEISAEKFGEEMVNDESSGPSSMDHDNYEEGVELMKAKNTEFGPMHTACLGISAIAIILAAAAALVYIYPTKKRAARAPRKASKAATVKVHLDKTTRKEKLTRVKPHVEFLQKKVESTSVKPPSSAVFSSLEETGKEQLTYHNQAPNVEFLGELVFGGKLSSSIRSNGRENKIIESEEISSKAISHADSGAYSVSPVPPSSVLDTGNSDSASYGSFTAEKKILKKQGGRDGSLKVITTPVRRSSRLQSRLVTSP